MTESGGLVHVSNDDEASRIRIEIETLKNERSDIDRKINELEDQLHKLKFKSKAVSNIEENGFGHGLSSDLIYRHSRHLMLPSFGVQGLYLLL